MRVQSIPTVFERISPVPIRPKGDLALSEKPGDGADIEKRSAKFRGNRRIVDPRNGAISASIASRNAQAKADARVQIAVVFGRTSREAMNGISMESATAIPHR
jgi:hypothetical protein